MEIANITRNQVVISRTFAELTSSEGVKHLKHLLSSALAEPVGAFGILVNERFGVNLMYLQPVEALPEALKEEPVARNGQSPDNIFPMQTKGTCSSG